ncbi:SAM-dependent methyltransferase [Polyangium sorediatum]|uniref:Class I SAM-dependent methyltransferase n=1 Tax=Polyangium sorediatum TaxID=889274 RepID=A0ABT6NZG5_9BACT|nr:class I SAM-dependent methyltransferase [Polyangium sorediatum]MDI1433718.1 class I SAM-dependent methyltransferase [Polyangium sorediatum]
MISPAHTRPEREAMERSPAEQREHERRVVAEHYQHDVEIFSMVLDSRLAYATGVFVRPDEDLETAQARKFARIQAKLDIQPGERVLDVGCGWGSNLLYLAEHTKGEFFGITLSERQREEAMRRARLAGVAERVHIDVRHVEDLALEPASFDVVLFSGSIVHMHNREEIHHAVARILRPSGRLLISDCYYPAEHRGDRESTATDYIFVEALGYCRLVHLSEELGFIERAGLDICHVEDLTSSYALTLERWIDNVRKNRRRIEAISPGFSRLLQQYMTVAKLSFARRTALEYMILATQGRPRVEVASFPIAPPAREKGER